MLMVGMSTGSKEFLSSWILKSFIRVLSCLASKVNPNLKMKHAFYLQRPSSFKSFIISFYIFGLTFKNLAQFTNKAFLALRQVKKLRLKAIWFLFTMVIPLSVRNFMIRYHELIVVLISYVKGLSMIKLYIEFS